MRAHGRTHTYIHTYIYIYKLIFHLTFVLKNIQNKPLLFSILVALPLVVHTTFHELRGSGRSWSIDENVKIMLGLYSFIIITYLLKSYYSSKK